MQNITVTLTMLLDKDMTKEGIEKMVDYGVLKMGAVHKWTVKVEETPEQEWG